ncbi:MAG TPA: RNA polymerase sigma factor [Candidatus Acidoferrales bacterium]|nr:RNA polymerase sigma factor [Candidatus Acidoferrales bacterium]
MNGVDVVGSFPVAEVADPTERLAALFDAHYERLYRLARRLTASTDDALDLVQETFLKVARSPKSIPNGLTPEEAWLVRVLVNTRRDQWRKASARRRHDSTASIATNSREFEATLIAQNTVWQTLDVLSPRRRAIVVMHELEELPIPAIASLLGISAITVRWHLSMGRHELMHALKAGGGGTK